MTKLGLLTELSIVKARIAMIMRDLLVVAKYDGKLMQSLSQAMLAIENTEKAAETLESGSVGQQQGE